MCGGPGAAYLYVRPDLVPRFAPRVTGWFGHEKPFAFTMPEQRYAPGMWRFMGGTPAIAALYQARAGAEIIGQIGVERIRRKSLRQTARMIEHVDELGFRLSSPRAPERRGGTVVFDFDGSGAVAAELNRRRFFCDHRPGAGIRVSPHFYTKDEEIELLFEEIQKISEPALDTCPKCGERAAQRLISQGNFILKGGGWYADLYSSSSSSKRSSRSESSSEGSSSTSETKSESSSETKSEAKSETKSESKSESKPKKTESKKA
jgi:putative FmdB family regulatory protein